MRAVLLRPGSSDGHAVAHQRIECPLVANAFVRLEKWPAAQKLADSLQA
jgi:hypothetical protein